MGIGSILSLLGGLGLFLFGMRYMGDGLELVAGPKMKDLLERLTRNRVMGFLLGALVTVVIQSSSATTVMVMGFINAGIMDLAQATGVIFGANIGTTITSVLIALDVSGIAPVCIAVGAVMFLYSKNKRYRYVGQVILGFGLLFQGLHTMSSAMSPLKDLPAFQNFIMNATNPLVGFLIGVVLCAVIQSSSAAVGVLQALAMQGLMPLQFAAFIICGINVGSSTPPILSAFNSKNNAKRAALIYLIFNIAGAVIFVPLSMFTPLTSFIAARIPNEMVQISLYHIMFKVVTGLILLPLENIVVSWTYRLIPKQSHESAFRLQYIDKNMQVASPAVVVLQVGKEVDRMADMVRQNFVLASTSLIQGGDDHAQEILDTEDVIDYLTSEITDYLTKINALELHTSVSRYMSNAFQAINDLEQIGDHAVKILDQKQRLEELNIEGFSQAATEEIEDIYKLDLDLFDTTMELFRDQNLTPDIWAQIRKRERRVIRHVSRAQTNHMERLKNKKCSFDQGVAFVEVLNSDERIVNHLVSIAEVSGGTLPLTVIRSEGKQTNSESAI